MFYVILVYYTCSRTVYHNLVLVISYGGVGGVPPPPSLWDYTSGTKRDYMSGTGDQTCRAAKNIENTVQFRVLSVYFLSFSTEFIIWLLIMRIFLLKKSRKYENLLVFSWLFYSEMHHISSQKRNYGLKLKKITIRKCGNIPHQATQDHTRP